MKRRAVSDLEIIAAYQSGEGVWRIAKRLNVSQMTIWRHLGKTGQALRTQRAQCYALQITTDVSAQGSPCPAVDLDGPCQQLPTAGHTYCPKHQLRYQRHGDAAIVLRRGRKKASV